MDATIGQDESCAPAHLAIQAMRDNGYRNTAYALAELIDNAVQADATSVELLCAEREIQLAQRVRRRIESIAVLDNGSGMNAEVLRIALQFGNGTRLETGRTSGIGRFGMGLPASSISQCKRVDVWSWQNGVESAIHTYLDVDEVKAGRRTTVPVPITDPVPEVWREAGQTFGQTGTLVVWSRLDRLMWRSARAIIDNSEFLIGRIYRRFLENGEFSIRLASFDYDLPSSTSQDKPALPNDPGYLMEHTSCPPPFDETPMFQTWGEQGHDAVYTVDFRGEHHEVRVRFSYAKEAARAGDQSGNQPYGQHAKKNIGVSIVRAGRELELDQSLVIQYDPRERWWGVEVEFPPGLDELFGVTNNKQTARNFAELAKFDIESLLRDGKTLHELKAEMEAEEDPRLPLLDVIHRIQTQLRVLRGLIKAQGADRRGTRGTQRHTAEETATERTRERQTEGHAGESDAGETLSAAERQEEIVEALEQNGVSEETAAELAATTVSSNLKYTFADAELETDAFFSVRPRGGAIIITLNTRHPAYDRLIEVLEDEINCTDAQDLASRLANAADGLRLLLMAWARYEDELADVLRQRAQDARSDWGRVARQFLRQDE